MTRLSAVPQAEPGRERSDIRPLRIGMLVGSVGEEGGGVSVSVQALSKALHCPPNVLVDVFAPDRSADRVDRVAWGPVRLNLFGVLGPSAFGYARGLLRALEESDLDILHVHGLWMYVSVAARRWAALTGRPYLVSPHGMLDPWAVSNSAWKKALALGLYEGRHLRGAACVHALCEPERQAIRAFGLTNPICTIANGVDPPELGGGVAARSRSPRKTLLYLGRLTPKKGLGPLLEAWATAKADAAGEAWDLIIAGAGASSYVAGLKKLVRDLGIGETVRFVGPRFGRDKADAFASADAFVLPSISEGQPVAVLEAWSYGLPALITSECNLPEGLEAAAALAIQPEAESQARGIARLFAMSDVERIEMGLRGRRLVGDAFCWRQSARELERVYRWALRTAPPPTTLTGA